MFTGLVEGMGEVVSLRRRRGGARLVVRARLPGKAPRLGESVAVDGTCLTVVWAGRGQMAFDLAPETLARTTLGQRRTGDRVNLERALRAGDRLGGHIVAGHVDGTGRLARIDEDSGGLRYTFEAPARLARYLVEKGSIAVDGVSLTAYNCHGRRFCVALIPHTLEVTTLGRKKPGDLVNLEADLVAKHIERLAAPYLQRLRRRPEQQTKGRRAAAAAGFRVTRRHRLAAKAAPQPARRSRAWKYSQYASRSPMT